MPTNIKPVPGIPKSQKLNDLMVAIATMEGFFNNRPSLAKKNNNPGNLRASSLAKTKVNGYCVFETIEIGWNALERQIRLDAGRGDDLRKFIYEYAPKEDNNMPDKYLAFVMKKTGIKAEEKLKDIL